MFDSPPPPLSAQALIERANELLSKTTPETWVADDFCEADGEVIRVGTTDGTDTYYHRSATVTICNHERAKDREPGVPHIGLLRAKWNAAFIAAAPQLVRDLLALLSAQKAEIARLEDRGAMILGNATREIVAQEADKATVEQKPPLKIRTICRCDEDGKPAGEHSADCPYAASLYAEAVRAALKPAE